jgi:hypothetical protein
MDLLPLLSDHLRQEGWVSCAGGQDLIPDLLQIDGLVPDISEKLQVKMFQKPGFHMALGLLQPSGETKTYGWEGVVPDGVFGIAQARKSWDLPFPLPPDTKRLMNEKLENFQIAILILPPQKDLPGRFQALCQEGHWESTVWKSSDANPVFLITKGNNKLMAVLNRQPSEDMITLVKFDQRKELL